MKSHLRKLGVEPLENRWVPAVILTLDASGNLRAILANGSPDLTLTFTAADEVNVDEGANDLGTYSVPGNLSVTMGNLAGAGTVVVDLEGFSMSGSLSIATGNATGGYAVDVDDGTIDGSLTVRTGNGDDDVEIGELDPVTVGGSVNVDIGAGALDNFNFEQSTINGNLRVVGANTLTFNDGIVDGSVSVDSRRDAGGVTMADTAGNTIGGNLLVTTGAGADDVDVNGVVSGNVVASLGNGDNDFSVNTTATILGNLTVTSGTGADDIEHVVAVIGGNMTVNAGNGDDTVRFDGATLLGRSVTLLGGNGDDLFEVGALTAPGARLTCLGGNGADTIDFLSVPDVASAYIDGGNGVDAFNVTGTIAFPIVVRNIP
jgi:hypothetical protein